MIEPKKNGAMTPKYAVLIGTILVLLAISVINGCIYAHAPKPPSYPEIRAAFFAPDGQSIYFTLIENKVFGLFRMDLNGKVGAWLFRGWPYEPAVSPDGGTLVFVLNNKKQWGDLFAMDADGRNLRWFTSGPNHDRSPRFSHDGKRIFFLRHDQWGAYPSIDAAEGWDSDIFSLDFATGKIRRISEESFYRVWAFSLFPADRFTLIFATEKPKTKVNLWKISLDGPKKLRSIEPVVRYASSHEVKFNEGIIPAARNCVILSRDGQYLVFAWQKSNHDKSRQKNYRQIFACSMQSLVAKKVAAANDLLFPRDISPNNQWIIFTGPSNKSRFDGGVLYPSNLWMVRRDGSGLKNFNLDFRGVLDKPPTALRLP
ncbi:MAG: hypothetical protein ABIK12_05895 [Pseudomonadota bacterium]